MVSLHLTDWGVYELSKNLNERNFICGEHMKRFERKEDTEDFAIVGFA